MTLLLRLKNDKVPSLSEQALRDHVKPKPDENSPDSKLLQELNEQIDFHRQQHSKQSYLEKAVSNVYNPSAKSLHDLILTREELERDYGRPSEKPAAQRAEEIEKTKPESWEI